MAVTKEELIQMVKNYKVNTEEVLKYVTDDSVRKALHEDTEKFNNAVELLALCEKDKNACKDAYYKIVVNSNMIKVMTATGIKIHIEFIVINKKSSLFMRKCVYDMNHDTATNTFYRLLAPIANASVGHSMVYNPDSPNRMFKNECIESDIVQFIDYTIDKYDYDDEYDDDYYEEVADKTQPVVDKRQVVEDPETHKRYYIVPVDDEKVVSSTSPYVYQHQYPTMPSFNTPMTGYNFSPFCTVVGPHGYYSNPTPLTPQFMPGYDVSTKA